MALKNDQVVTINFILKDDEETVVDSTEGSQPFSFISGRNQILPKLETEIGNMLIGSNKKITLSAKEGYGEFKAEAVRTVKREDFPEGTEIEEGMDFMANSPDGHQMPFIVTQIDGDDITLDFNHPLAGKQLNFDVELLDVRNATAEELEHGHVHGVGGHHH